MENRREMERFELNLLSSVQIKEEGIPIKKNNYMVVKNICAGGVYFETDAPLPVDSKLVLELFLGPKIQDDGKTVSCIEVTGTVVRHEKEGMVVKFDDDYRISPLLRKNGKNGNGSDNGDQAF